MFNTPDTNSFDPLFIVGHKAVHVALLIFYNARSEIQDKENEKGMFYIL